MTNVVGINIKNRRIELGMTQEELAEKLGYTSKSSIAKIETGKNDVTQSKIVAFAKVLQTTPSYLMGWDSNRTHDSGIDETEAKKEDDFKAQLADYNDTKFDLLKKTAIYINHYADIEDYAKVLDLYEYIIENDFTSDETGRLIDYAKFLASQRK